MPSLEGIDNFLDELPNVDRRSCRLLGPTALVRLTWRLVKSEGAQRAHGAGVFAGCAGAHGRARYPLSGV